MTARFDSICPACDREILAGSPIVKDWRFGRYVHRHCVDLVEYDDAEYARGVNDVRQAQLAGPAGSAAREAAYLAMEAQWAREGWDG